MRRVQYRAAVVPAVLVSFLVGVLLAALIVPDHPSAGTSRLQFGASPAGGASGGGSAPGSVPGGGTATGSSGGVALASGGGTAAGEAGDASSRVTGSASSAGSATGPSRAGGSGTSGSAGGGSTTAIGPTNNGGATATGVTANSITVGVIDADSSGLQAACPRCGQGGLQTDKYVVPGLIALWHQEGLLPVNGRDLEPVFASGNDVSAETFQAACEQVAGHTPFVVISPAGNGNTTANCMATQYHTLTLDASNELTDADLAGDYPYAWEIGPSFDRIMRNWADWLNLQGLLKGQVLGLYTPANSSTAPSTQAYVDVFRAEIKKLGYSIKIDYTYTSTGSSDDPLAVTQMKNAGVTEVLVYGSLTEPSGFQNQAVQVGYHPKYPMVDAGYSFTDATADVEFNASEEDGNIGMGTRFWNWANRNPATPSGDPAAAECLKAYENESHTIIDVYNDDAKIRYLLDECSDMQMLLQALRNAGPRLTVSSFDQGIEGVRNVQVAEWQEVSMGANPKTSGSLFWATGKFNKARWQPENDYIRLVGPWTPWLN